MKCLRRISAHKKLGYILDHLDIQPYTVAAVVERRKKVSACGPTLRCKLYASHLELRHLAKGMYQVKYIGRYLHPS